MIITLASPANFFLPLALFLFMHHHASTKIVPAYFPTLRWIHKSHKSILRRTWFVMCCSSSCCLVSPDLMAEEQELISLLCFWNVDIIVSVEHRTELNGSIASCHQLNVPRRLLYWIFFYHYQVTGKARD